MNDLATENSQGGPSSSRNVPFILQGYFNLTSEFVDGKASGTCSLCTNSKTFIGNMNATSNLLRHLVSF